MKGQIGPNELTTAILGNEVEDSAYDGTWAYSMNVSGDVPVNVWSMAVCCHD